MGSGGLETAADRGQEGGGSEGESGYIGFPRLPFILRARTSPYIQERRSRRRVKDRLPFVALCREQLRVVSFLSRPWSVLARFWPPSAAVRKSYAACATHSKHIAGPRFDIPHVAACGCHAALVGGFVLAGGSKPWRHLPWPPSALLDPVGTRANVALVLRLYCGGVLPTSSSCALVQPSLRCEVSIRTSDTEKT